MKNFFVIASIVAVLCAPLMARADGGMMIWPPTVYLEQSAQNAIVAWDGKEEILTISTNMKSSAAGTALRVVPLPSNPTDIKEGAFESFDAITSLVNKKLSQLPSSPGQSIGGNIRKAGDAVEGGVQITFQKNKAS